jgi:hypothetical protein
VQRGQGGQAERNDQCHREAAPTPHGALGGLILRVDPSRITGLL